VASHVPHSVNAGRDACTQLQIVPQGGERVISACMWQGVLHVNLILGGFGTCPFRSGRSQHLEAATSGPPLTRFVRSSALNFSAGD